MRCLKKIHEQNSGFSLIELLIAIAILAMLTVPLMNSFIMSGKVTRNSRRLQNATAVAQSITETVKHTTDKAALEAALKSFPGVYEFPADSKAGETSPEYTFKINGEDGERFRVSVKLIPKTEYDYKETDFADLYNEANVIYSELILYDNKVISLMKNQKIPYGTSTAPAKYKWDGTTWITDSVTADDVALRDTFGNLIADEYVGSAPEGMSSSDLTDMYAKLKKENIDKTVAVVVSQEGNDYKLAINTTYSIKYDVVYRAEDKDAIPVPGGKTPMAFYRCIGTLVYQADEIVLTFDNEKPLYFLYAKAEGGRTEADGTEISADVRHFNSVKYNIKIDGSVNLADEDGNARNVLLYLVEQAGTRQEDSFSINVENDSYSTALDIYTTENYNNPAAPADSTLTIGKTGKHVEVYSVKNESNKDKHIAYNKGDEITALYKITVSVDYDVNRDGSYSEHVYSVSTED